MPTDTIKLCAYVNVGVAETDTFLTDARRAVLNGEYDGAANVERTHESRIRDRSRSALAELVEVANSTEIENESVFDPEMVRAFLTSLATRGGLQEHGYEHVSEAYRNALYVEIDQVLRNWDGGSDE